MNWGLRWSLALACGLALGCTTVALDEAPREATVVPAPTPAGPSTRAETADRAANGEPRAAPEPDPLDAAADALRALRPDPAPEAITNDKHYLVSNERRLDLYRPDIDGLGGAYVGVGSDQNYILAGFVQPSLVVIVDFDQAVVDLHAIHGALVRAAPDAETFLHLWSEAGQADALAILEADVEDPDRARTLCDLYVMARPEVHARFSKLEKRYAQLGVRAWLEVPEQYATVRELFATDRIVAIRGDLTQPGVVREIAEVLKAHGQVVRVLYLSNVEQYVAYRAAWKANMLALPLGDDSLVLRTLPGRPAGFQYILQRGPDFQAWMRARKVWSVYRMRGLARGEHLVASERFFIEALPSDRFGPRAP